MDEPYPTDPRLSAASLVLQPHILDSILLSSDRDTLATCLRVNKTFHQVAGAILYHTVRVDGHNMKKFFLGAFVGTDIEEDDLECSLLRGEQCTRFTKPEGTVISESETLVLPTSTQQTQVDGAPSPADHRLSPLCPTNFKAPLLALVRVLSLGSHHSCLCHVYGETIGPLLKTLDTLRIVPAPLTACTLDTVCDDHNYCPLFDSLRPRKVVFRNVGEHRVFCGQGSEEAWNKQRLEEVVDILPTDGRAYRNDTVDSLQDVPCFNRASKILFHSGWEVWQSSANAVPNNSDDQRIPVRPVDLIQPLKSDAVGFMFGLETVELDGGGPQPADECPIVNAFRHVHPHEPTTSDRLRQLVKDEIMTGSIWGVAFGNDGWDQQDPFLYKTIADYEHLLVQERRFEVDDGLDPILNVASLQSQLLFSPSLRYNRNLRNASNGLIALGVNPFALVDLDTLVPFTCSTIRYIRTINDLSDQTS